MMPRFFVTPEQMDGDTVTVIGQDAHHLSRSLRMAAGKTITVCDMAGNDYLCVLTDFLPDCVKAKILKKEKSVAEPPYRATVFQALPKGEKLDAVIQKSVECGAVGVKLFESSRCIAKMQAGERDKKKNDRWNRIAEEAAKQCGRAVLPTVESVSSFRNALKEASAAELPLFCYEGEGTVPLPQAIREVCRKLGRAPQSISVTVGSEGGFSPEEARQAAEAGMIMVGLGNRILRTETASSFVLSCLVYALELNENG